MSMIGVDVFGDVFYPNPPGPGARDIKDNQSSNTQDIYILGHTG